MGGCHILEQHWPACPADARPAGGYYDIAGCSMGSASVWVMLPRGGREGAEWEASAGEALCFGTGSSSPHALPPCRIPPLAPWPSNRVQTLRGRCAAPIAAPGGSPAPWCQATCRTPPAACTPPPSPLPPPPTSKVRRKKRSNVR